MGGFLFNGCGLADTVSKLRLLKTDMCPDCHKEREFYLAKVRMRIHVIFIPTIPLNTKYAIVCSKCKTGRYISEEQMRQLMSADEATIALLYDAIMHNDTPVEVQPENSLKNDALPAKETVVSLPEPEAVVNSGAQLTCSNCGHALKGGETFCGFCGVRLPEPEAVVNSGAQLTCSNCGHALKGGETFCGFCGVRLPEPEAVVNPGNQSTSEPEAVVNPGNQLTSEPEAVVNPGNQLTCSNCGRALKEGETFCGFCGVRLPEPEAVVNSGNQLASEPEAIVNPGAQLTCSNCGRALKEGEAFCGFCGHSVTTEAAILVEESAVDENAGQVDEVPVQKTALNHADNETAMWQCPLCDTKNPSSADRCQLCGQVRS